MLFEKVFEVFVECSGSNGSLWQKNLPESTLAGEIASTLWTNKKHDVWQAKILVIIHHSILSSPSSPLYTQRATKTTCDGAGEEGFLFLILRVSHWCRPQVHLGILVNNSRDGKVFFSSFKSAWNKVLWIFHKVHLHCKFQDKSLKKKKKKHSCW